MTSSICLEKCRELVYLDQVQCNQNCLNEELEQTLRSGTNMMIGACLTLTIVYAVGFYFVNIKRVERELLVKMRTYSTRDYSDELAQLEENRNCFGRSLAVITTLAGVLFLMEMVGYKIAFRK